MSLAWQDRVDGSCMSPGEPASSSGLVQGWAGGGAWQVLGWSVSVSLLGRDDFRLDWEVFFHAALGITF